jgi:hypothetical protein
MPAAANIPFSIATALGQKLADEEPTEMNVTVSADNGVETESVSAMAAAPAIAVIARRLV